MRVILMIVGFIVALNGVVWALQGAYVLEATFMRGPEWIAIGAAVFLVGAFMMWLARGTKQAAQAEASTP